MESVRQPVFISCQVKCASGDYIFFAIKVLIFSWLLLQMSNLIDTSRLLNYFAYKDGRTCYCEYTYDEDEEIPKHNCSLICDDGKHICGGPGVYSVYLS